MIEIPFWVNDNTVRNIHLVFQERIGINCDQMITESMTFTESLCSAEDLKFGKAEKSVFEIDLMDVDDIKTGMQFELRYEFITDKSYEGVIYNSEIEARVYPINLGFFEVKSYEINRLKAYSVDFATVELPKVFEKTILYYRNKNLEYKFNPEVLYHLNDDKSSGWRQEPTKYIQKPGKKSGSYSTGWYVHSTGKRPYELNIPSNTDISIEIPAGYTNWNYILIRYSREITSSDSIEIKYGFGKDTYSFPADNKLIYFPDQLNNFTLRVNTIPTIGNDISVYIFYSDIINDNNRAILARNSFSYNYRLDYYAPDINYNKICYRELDMTQEERQALADTTALYNSLLNWRDTDSDLQNIPVDKFAEIIDEAFANINSEKDIIYNDDIYMLNTIDQLRGYLDSMVINTFFEDGMSLLWYSDDSISEFIWDELIGESIRKFCSRCDFYSKALSVLPNTITYSGSDFDKFFEKDFFYNLFSSLAELSGQFYVFDSKENRYIYKSIKDNLFAIDYSMLSQIRLEKAKDLGIGTVIYKYYRKSQGKTVELDGIRYLYPKKIKKNHIYASIVPLTYDGSNIIEAELNIKFDGDIKIINPYYQNLIEHSNTYTLVFEKDNITWTRDVVFTGETTVIDIRSNNGDLRYLKKIRFQAIYYEYLGAIEISQDEYYPEGREYDLTENAVLGEGLTLEQLETYIDGFVSSVRNQNYERANIIIPYFTEYELGDIVNIFKDGQKVAVPVLRQTRKGIQFLTTNIQAGGL